MSVKDLINTVDHLRIWGQLIGVQDFNTRFCSPFREDKDPGCKLFMKNGEVKFADKSRGVIMDVVDAHKFFYPNQSWAERCDHLMNMSGSSVSTREQLLKGTMKSPSVKITPLIGDWTPSGLAFWEKRGVTLEALSDPQTLTQQITGYIVEGEDEKGPYHKEISKRGFIYWVGERFKLYFPYEDSKKKFKGHFKNNDVWLFKQPRNTTGTLLIAKSNKDLQVWKKFVNADLMSVASEGVFPDPNWLFTHVRMVYKRVIIVFDPDKAGVEGANKLRDLLCGMSEIGNFVVEIWNWPDSETKDLDKYRTDHSHNETKLFLTDNGFYNIFK